MGPKESGVVKVSLLAFSATVFQYCNLPGVSRSASNQVLGDEAKIRKAETHLSTE